MSQSVKYIFIAALAIAPKLALASTASFKDESWTIDPLVSKVQQTLIVRNDFDLKNMAAHILTGKPVITQAIVLDQATAQTEDQMQQAINQPTVNAQLTIENGWATTFVPDQNGQSVDTYELTQNLAENLDQINIPVKISEPEVRLADLNNLGINELIATGESDFSGSTKNRITNVKVGSSKYQGLIIQPGEEFSFNKYLGDIDAAHGYEPELVIKAAGVESEFGGGLCQVSTTMFRAAMNAGMPITERRNHSFAVHYYSPQGTDATIYPGSADLKFVNDYASAILIRTYIVGHDLYFEMYGTKDDRTVTFDGPVQYDQKSDGSLKATWTRNVTKNGQTTTYVAKSTYVSPALYEKVDQPSTPNPQAVATPANTETVPTQTN